MAYKMNAQARAVYAAMDNYINFMIMNKQRRPCVHITRKQHEIICAHLTRMARDKLKKAPDVKHFDEYRGCKVIVIK